MACFSPNGGLPPQPPRAWNRVQGACSTEASQTNNPIVYFPLTGEYMRVEQAAEAYQMINKGNVLQYKKNSSDLTRNQRYSLIAKGQWTNRSKSFASQNILTSNPNTNGLKRVNYNTIYADDGSSANGLPVTCTTPVTPTTPSQLPANPNPPAPPVPEIKPDIEYCPQYVDPASLDPVKKVVPKKKKLPPRIIPKEKKKIKNLPYIKNPVPAKARDVIPEGGNLVCIVEDICGNEKVSGQQQAYLNPTYCNPTTDSDVPGPIQDLCYNSRRLPTYYPRQRRVMTNSGDKFPTGYKFE